MDIKKQVANILRIIESQNLSEKELDQLYTNAEAYPDLDETDREIILDAITKKLWATSPARAKKRFGAKDMFAQELLRPVFDRTMSAFDLRGNKVLNKVKIGGDMRSGKAFVDVYISYKNDDKRRVLLNIRQETADHLPFCIVFDDDFRSNDEGERLKFALADFEKAAALYEAKLAEIAPKH